MAVALEKPRFSDDDFGIYLHIPFCKSICSYCNFLKTAAYSDELVGRYFAKLHLHLKYWLNSGIIPPTQAISSLFIGGGTPSLFTELYAPLMELLTPRLTTDCEITLEANVDDITADRLAAWHGLGINRLSMGVQSFDDERLIMLKRRHNRATATAGIELCRATFDHVNIDLIYGIPTQSETNFLTELQLCEQMGIGHLSLYNLTYEPSTLLGKRQAQGKFAAMDEELEVQLFNAARRELFATGYHHEEVSNWALPGHSCRHNWLYWRDRPYLGIGSSAHSYLKTNAPPGQRFFYASSPQEFATFSPSISTTIAPEEMIAALGATLDQRDVEGWILETVWCGLRTDCGVAIAQIAAASGTIFQPTAILQRGLAEGIVQLSPNAEHLFLDHDHWFRESAWAVEVAISFRLLAAAPY